MGLWFQRESSLVAGKSIGKLRGTRPGGRNKEAEGSCLQTQANWQEARLSQSPPMPQTMYFLHQDHALPDLPKQCHQPEDPVSKQQILQWTFPTASLSPVTFCCVWGLDSQDTHEPSTYPLLFSLLEWNPAPCMSQAMFHHRAAAPLTSRFLSIHTLSIVGSPL